MEFELLGWPAEGPTLRLDYEQFSYAGKFVMSSTGKAVVREDGDVVAAAAFDPDRTDDSALRIRYVTVRRDRRGEGIGSRLLRTVRERASERGFGRVVIAVNNPFAYEAASKAGFGYTGERTGLAERVLAWPAPNRDERYREGLTTFREDDLESGVAEFVESRETAPPVVEPFST
ncbi:GNAT family N-acetyltransferase [Halapricum desulfuricans]|uniref:Acetyltransferase (GNAT) family n=1 Tax=Halapricum desulfuricans TaxID=2841257 RepID=A0A897N7Y1_9EURY|nr:GNAT family N-acetyltransferase [Halapricum desulfuricans]QSG08378.1 Acetyltransferase (GNAT) family [Halapricum desulfuricans]